MSITFKITSRYTWFDSTRGRGSCEIVNGFPFCFDGHFRNVAVSSPITATMTTRSSTRAMLITQSGLLRDRAVLTTSVFLPLLIPRHPLVLRTVVCARPRMSARM